MVAEQGRTTRLAGHVFIKSCLSDKVRVRLLRVWRPTASALDCDFRNQSTQPGGLEWRHL